MASRWEKEEAKKLNKERFGLTPEEITALDKEKVDQVIFEDTVRDVHTKLFPEEYDFMFDDHVDVKARSQGHNPMSTEYQEQVLRRRKSLGFKPLSESGYAQDDETLDYVRSTLKIDGVEPLLQLIFKFGLDDRIK